MPTKYLIIFLSLVAQMMLIHLAHAASAMPNFNINGIAPPGHPNFDTPVNITVGKLGIASGAGFQLASTNSTSSFQFQYNATSAWNVSGSYSISALVNSSGGVVGGTFAVNGVIPGYNGPGTTPIAASQNLFTGIITSVGSDTINGDGTPVALGLKTSGFSGWASQFADGSAESIYLSNFNVPWLVSMVDNPKFKNMGFQGAAALTTVPLPASLWLFGSACLFLLGFNTKNSFIS